jgi:hypothetical protein
MRDPDRLSFGVTGVHAQGRVPVTFLILLICALVVGAFATGRISALLDSCFGLRPF